MAETAELGRTQTEELIYALDIGTRSVIGMLGRVEDGRVRILAVETQPHRKRAMRDGQIEDIAQVAEAVVSVTRRLEREIGLRLTRACVAAAGRSLRMEQGRGALELPAVETIREEQIVRLEAAAVSDAEQALQDQTDAEQRLFLVGYTATRFLVDGYPMTSLLGHTGRRLEAEVVATFLPGEVIDSLYAVMRQAGLEIASLTLEPIAALNAAIPAELRLLNLALVDIGAGTSDIAICREGSVVGYTMATVAGDEITEALMRAFLVDYTTAEEMKTRLGEEETLTFTDILGMEQSCSAEEVRAATEGAARNLVEEISKQVLQLNGGPPSALFLAGGGSKLAHLRERVAEALGMDARRVALAGAHFKTSACSDVVRLEDPEYTTPLGIAVSAGLGLISDSYRITLNGTPAKLFRNGRLTLLELLMMNGYGYRELLGRSGKGVVLEVGGRRMAFPGEPALPARLTVNGEEAQPSAVVHAGDQIQFVAAVPGADRKVLARDVMARLKGARVALDGAVLEPDQEIPNGARLEVLDGAAPAAPPAAQEPEAPAPAPASPAAPAPEPPEAPPAKQVPGPRPCSFLLNSRPLTLPAKENGQPYYLMDLLEHSGIDFKHVDRPVLLRVNGAACTFQQVLQPGDRVEIRYET